MSSPRPLIAIEGGPPSKVAIMAAAVRLFARHGFDGTTIRQIAAEAGYTGPALFKFFESKAELAEELFVECYGGVSERLDKALQPVKDVHQGIDVILRVYFELIETEHDALLFMDEHVLMFLPRVRGRLVGPTIVRILCAFLERMRGSGMIDAKVRIEAQVVAVSGVLAHFSRLIYFDEIRWRRATQRDRRELKAAIATTLLRALGPPSFRVREVSGE